MPPLKVFVSYSIKDRRLAKQIKKGLLTYGMNVFLAHDDIEASAQWANVILATLKESDVFLPLLTEAFSTSEWTDQETGVALAHRKLIIPLKVDRDPYGFVAQPPPSMRISGFSKLYSIGQYGTDDSPTIL